MEKIKFPSELRFDLISEDWVVIATGRAKRPEDFREEKREKKEVSQKNCPFCQEEIKKKAILVFNQGKKVQDRNFKEWTTIIIPNKFPAFSPHHQPPQPPRIEGNLFQTINAVGFHEVIITKDHQKSIGQLKTEQVKEIIDIYQERYLQLKKIPFVNYIAIFYNHGREAGASISHPHSQIITTPLIDVDSKRALLNSQKYYRKNKKCIYCQMNNWERKVKKRIVFENKDFLVLCPFASKAAFQMIISPKKHLSYFEKITEKEKWQLAEAFQMALAKLYQGLNNPPYNFYLKTAPGNKKDYSFYHWHWTILPKTSIWAGFELGARMEISTIEPEKAAEYLRKQ